MLRLSLQPLSPQQWGGASCLFRTVGSSSTPSTPAFPVEWSSRQHCPPSVSASFTPLWGKSSPRAASALRIPSQLLVTIPVGSGAAPSFHPHLLLLASLEGQDGLFSACQFVDVSCVSPCVGQGCLLHCLTVIYRVGHYSFGGARDRTLIKITTMAAQGMVSQPSPPHHTAA